MNSGENDFDRRNFLKAAAAAGATGAIAGCTDLGDEGPGETTDDTTYDDTTYDDTTDDTTNDDTADDTTEDDTTEEKGLDIDFTWEDIKQAELDHYESATRVEEALEVADETRIENADLLDYDEFQDVLLTTVNEIVHHFGESMDQDSSTTASTAAPAVNLILNDLLEQNERYQEEGLQIKMMPLTNDGHGYTQVASTHHPLTTVDSNAEAVGKPEERPLEEQRNVEVRDPISRFVDKDFEDVDEFERGSYQAIVLQTYSKGTDSSRNIGIDSEVIDEYHDEVIFGGERELIFEAIRPAIGTMRLLLDEEYTDKEALMITSSPADLPKIDDYDDLNQYGEELLENHLEEYDDRDELIEQAFTP